RTAVDLTRLEHEPTVAGKGDDLVKTGLFGHGGSNGRMLRGDTPVITGISDLTVGPAAATRPVLPTTSAGSAGDVVECRVHGLLPSAPDTAECTSCRRQEPVRSARSRALDGVGCRWQAESMQQRVSFITLAVADVARSRAFYVGGLGWQPIFEADEVLMLPVADRVILSLWSVEGFTAEIGEAPASGLAPITLSHNLATEAE